MKTQRDRLANITQNSLDSLIKEYEEQIENLMFENQGLHDEIEELLLQIEGLTE